MRTIASSIQRVMGGVFLAVLVTLVGCGGTSLRRPLVTDQTPIGTPEAEVRAWYAKNGWCADAKPARWGDKVLFYRPCTGADRQRVATVLRFKEDGTLYAAWVYARVPPGAAPGRPSGPISSGDPSPKIGVRHEPGSAGERPARSPLRRPPDRSYEAPSDPAIELVDALAFEIEARHGDGEAYSPEVRAWNTRRETIMLYVQEGWVVEAHWPAVCGTCLP
jgi:hypothetical protein